MPRGVCTGGPTRSLGGIVDRNCDNPAVIVAAVSPVTAIGDVKDAVVQQKCAALILIGRIELNVLKRDDGGVDRPAGKRGAVVEREGEDEMLRGDSTIRRRHGIGVNDAVPFIDDGRARNAERIDVAAGGVYSEGHGSSESAAPNLGTVGGVERQDDVLLGRDDQRCTPAGAVGHVERLCIGGAGQWRVEGRIAMNESGVVLSDEGVGVTAVAGAVEMVLQDISRDKILLTSGVMWKSRNQRGARWTSFE